MKGKRLLQFGEKNDMIPLFLQMKGNMRQELQVHRERAEAGKPVSCSGRYHFRMKADAVR